jgi:hypothetical protein
MRPDGHYDHYDNYDDANGYDDGDTNDDDDIFSILSPHAVLQFTTKTSSNLSDSPMILRLSLVPRVMPKLRSLAFSKPGTTALSAWRAYMAWARPSISAWTTGNLSSYHAFSVLLMMRELNLENYLKGTV